MKQRPACSRLSPSLRSSALPPSRARMSPAAMIDPEWMNKAERVARTFRATSAGERGAGHHVYVIQLHDPSRAGRWGLYVGQTSRDPDWRFDQHKSGYKASGAVRRFGVRLL